jgi:hypothetical protein
MTAPAVTQPSLAPADAAKRQRFLEAIARLVARHVLAELDSQHATAHRAGELAVRGLEESSGSKPNPTP